MQPFEGSEGETLLTIHGRPIESPEGDRTHSYTTTKHGCLVQGGAKTTITFTPTKQERAHRQATSARLLLSKPPTETARCSNSVNLRPRSIESSASIPRTSVPCKFSLETLVRSHLWNDYRSFGRERDEKHRQKDFKIVRTLH